MSQEGHLVRQIAHGIPQCTANLHNEICANLTLAFISQPLVLLAMVGLWWQVLCFSLGVCPGFEETE